MTAEADALLQRAAKLVPVLRARAEETERARCVPEESIAELVEAGLFRILQPKRFGGYELDFNVLLRSIFEIARGCGSTAWVYGLSATCQWLLSLFPQETQEEIWGATPDGHLQGAVAPSAVAEKVAGGYRIAGTWNYTSGCDHADWMFVAALLPGEDGAPPAPGFLFLPRSEYRIEDNWHTVGLCGTGSKNIVLDGSFVPSHRAIGFAALSSGRAPGTAFHANPLYRIPFMAVLPAAIAAPALGIAQAALDDFRDGVRGRTTKGAVAGAGGKMAEFSAVQTRVAEASGLIDAARLLLLRDADDTLAAVSSGGIVDLDRRIRNRRDHALAVKFCVEAVNGLYASTGAGGLFLDNRLQRGWRDINAIAKHISVNWDAVSSMYGQHAFGLPPRGQY